MKEIRKKGRLVAISKHVHFQPDIQVQENINFDAFTGDGCPHAYMNTEERVWGTRPWYQLVARIKYAWIILRRGIGAYGDICLSPKDCKKMGNNLIALGKWLEANRWNGKKPRLIWSCKDCGSKRIDRSEK